jgi:hypothetical protein
MNKEILLILAAAVIAGAGFSGGMIYEKSANKSRFQNPGNFSLEKSGQIGNRGQNQPISGEIISKDETGITVKLKDGGSKIIFVSSSTKITESVEKNSDSLSIGTQAVIIGSSDSNGIITASSIQMGIK